ncbi:MAG TPA: signal peptidase I [Candidatus Aquilonibacter sp.]|nr:signal peptidase I [Candidatus Aquilonibacter sp.]
MDSTDSQRTSHKGLWIGLASVIGICVIIAIITIPTAFKQLTQTRTFRLSNDSMQPTLYNGDLITVDTGYYSEHSVADGDLIVFRHDGVVLVKRISAISGETIEGKNDKLIRNGSVLAEPYVKSPDEPSDPSEASFPLRIVSQGQVFVTGDWRSKSLDSRYPDYAPVHLSDIVGKVVYIYSSSHSGQVGRKF